ncbi:glutamate-cysteine ligase family protein [Hoyosella sp. YIM 151337]|uniref:glutamate-cysteine ligase family protein n=1 Tax=Hoyosella sp. YIM 151337 TaxID=2992742 RepID=UPI002235D41B|nr:glutamate-cysteine ligase family protein [Hoyosella sp. YIM 151337]MCW4352956.1 glutamate-cysteine ligase family protein [Hoyosella sp. YIM 151337]
MHPGSPELWIRSHDEAIQLICEHTVAVADDMTVGAELEWLVVRRGCGADRVAVADLSRSLGQYAPQHDGRSAPLPSGSVLTIEPGGQVELSSAPFSSARALTEALSADTAVVRSCLARESIDLISAAADTTRPPVRVLDAPRYRAMENVFDRNGPAGRVMMNNTAAVQVCVSAGSSPSEALRRWLMLNEAGPALLAAFAASPAIAGGPPGRWESQRMRAWFTLDPQRTLPPRSQNPLRDYAEWALTVPLLCIRRPGSCWDAPAGLTLAEWIAAGAGQMTAPHVLPQRYPARDDVLYHLSTLFPPVRPRGYFEVRYLDQQPADHWRAAVAVVTTLAHDSRTVDTSRDLAAETADLWLEAARLGMQHPKLAAAATALLEFAAASAPEPILRTAIESYLCTIRSRSDTQVAAARPRQRGGL